MLAVLVADVVADVVADEVALVNLPTSSRGCLGGGLGVAEGDL